MSDTKEIMMLNNTVLVRSLLRRLGVSLDVVKALQLTSIDSATLQLHEKISYATAKEIAGVFGHETRKRMHYDAKEGAELKLFDDSEYHSFHQYMHHNEHLNVVDTSLIPIFYMHAKKQLEGGAAPIGLGYGKLYPAKKGLEEKPTLSQRTTQGKHHISSLADQLHQPEEELLRQLQQGFSKISYKNTRPLLDTSDILTYLVQGMHDRFRYKKTNEALHEFFGEKDAPLMMLLLSATSIRATLDSNVTKALKAYTQIQNGSDHEGFMLGIKKALNYIRPDIDRIRNGEWINSLQGRKTKNFADAMYGIPDAVVVDVWMMRAFRVYARERRSPSTSIYDQIENYVKFVAGHIGREPREIHSAIRAGIRSKYNNQTRYVPVIEKYVKGLGNKKNGHGDPRYI